MSEFKVYPIEAVMLGVAYGEYRRLCERGLDLDFDAALYRRVYPFVPDLTRLKETCIEGAEFTAELEWKPMPNGSERYELGFPPEADGAALNRWQQVKSRYDALALVRRGIDIYRVDLDDSRHNLLDLLMQYFTAGHEKPRDKFNDPAELYRRWHIAPPDFPQGPRRQRLTPDRIAVLLNALMRHRENECEDLFAVGRTLGAVFGECIAVEDHIARLEDAWHPSSAYQLVDFQDADADMERRDVLPADSKEIVASVNTVLCAMENAWLELADAIRNDKSLRQYVEGIEFADGGSACRQAATSAYTPIQWSSTIASRSALLLVMRTNLCLILGQVRGRLYGRDTDAREANKSDPRMLMISPSAKSDRVGGAVLMMQRKLDDELGHDYPPETYIMNFGNSVEVLARDLWSIDESEKILPVMQHNARFGTELEQRFAAIAMPLYHHYRGRGAQRPPDRFRCTYHEVSHFKSGVAAMLVLKRQIEIERKQKA